MDRALEPRRSQVKRGNPVAGDFDADLRRRVDSNQQQKASDEALVHAWPQPTSTTPRAIQVIAAMRGRVMCSPKQSQPPSITPTMVMLPAITPWPSGTRDKNATHTKKSARAMAIPTQSTGRLRRVSQ